MALNKMMYCVLQASYSVQIGDGVISQELDGGAPRYRRALKGTHHTGNVEWKVYPKGYQYLMAFYRVWARNPNQPFLIKLCADNAPVEDYQAYFASSPVLSGKEANIYTVTASLRVKPLAVNEAADDLIVAVGDQDMDIGDLLNPLDELVNVVFPEALGVNNG